jgi:hypothetical protein
MTLLAGTLIDEARDLHVSFNERHHPSKLLLRELDRYQGQLLSRALQINEDYQGVVLQALLPLSVFPNGIAITSARIPTRAEAVDQRDVPHELELRAWAYRQDPAPLLCGYVYNSTLFLRGEAADWTAFKRIDLYLQPLATALTALTGTGGTLTIGDSARAPLVGRLAALMATRAHTDPELPQPTPGLFTDQWLQAESEFLREIASSRDGEMFQVREVW